MKDKIKAARVRFNSCWLVFLAGLCGGAAMSQPERKLPEWQVVLQGGLRPVGLGDLPAPSGLSGTEWVFFSRSVAGQVFVNRWHIALGSGQSGINKVAIGSQQELELSFRNVFVRTGYDLLRAENGRLFPFAGLALYTMRMELDDLSTPPDFPNLLRNGYRNASLDQRNNTALELGLGYQRAFRLGREAWLGTVGVSAGYQFALRQTDWVMSGIRQADGPSTQLNGWFLTLGVGVGRRQKQ